VRLPILVVGGSNHAIQVLVAKKRTSRLGQYVTGSGNRRCLPSHGPHCVLRNREHSLGVSERLESIPDGTVARKSQHEAPWGGNCARLLWRRHVIISPMKEFTHRCLARRLWQTRAPWRPLLGLRKLRTISLPIFRNSYTCFLTRKFRARLEH